MGVCVCLHACMCVCVCVRERERKMSSGLGRHNFTHTATHNILQHAATHGNTLQHAATHGNTRCAGTRQSQLHTYCNTIQHGATHCNARCAGTTGWRRLMGSPKLQIIFHKRATKYRSLLREMTYKDKASYESSPPCRQSQSRTYCIALQRTATHCNTL